MMEMEQMMECLLARMDIKQAADRKANQDELTAIMNAFQEKMDSNQEKAEASMAKLEE
jgi:Skp family chaperone for outer membrane proteins